MISLRIDGAARLRAVSAAVKEAADGGLQRELRRGIRRALDPFTDAVRASAVRTMPGGYAPVLSSALQFRISNVASGLRVTTFAKGKAEDRDLVALDAGRLRHPVFGRTRLVRRGRSLLPQPSPWSLQAIRPGFFTRPADRLADEAAQRVLEAVDAVADRIERG